jgi:MFS family permease
MQTSMRRAVAAAAALIILASNSTATSALFVAYRIHWGLTAAGIGLAFAAYVGTLLPVLFLFGGLPDRFGRRTAILSGMLFMVSGTLTLVFAHGLALLIAGRFLQGIGAALAIGSISATFSESYRGKIATGQALAVVTAVALSAGPLVTAIAYDLGAGPNLAYLPMLVLGVGMLGLVPAFPGRTPRTTVVRPADDVLAPDVVRRGLRFAMPLVFVAWSGTSLYLSLVPAYLAAALHAVNPLIGAGAFLATQLAAIAASIRFGNVAPERSGVIAPAFVVLGLALLVVGTSAHLWSLIVVATIAVGAGGGVASGAAYAIAGRIGRGQLARVFARLLFAAYAGYSLPSVVTGAIADHASFAAGFATVIGALAVIVATLPLLRERRTAPARGQAAPLAAA